MHLANTNCIKFTWCNFFYRFSPDFKSTNYPKYPCGKIITLQCLSKLQISFLIQNLHFTTKILSGYFDHKAATWGSGFQVWWSLWPFHLWHLKCSSLIFSDLNLVYMQMHTKSAYISEKHVQYVNECPLDSAAIPFTRILLTLSICLNNNCSAEKAEPFSLWEFKSVG